MTMRSSMISKATAAGVGAILAASSCVEAFNPGKYIDYVPYTRSYYDSSISLPDCNSKDSVMAYLASEVYYGKHFVGYDPKTKKPKLDYGQWVVPCDANKPMHDGSKFPTIECTPTFVNIGGTSDQDDDTIPYSSSDPIDVFQDRAMACVWKEKCPFKMPAFNYNTEDAMFGVGTDLNGKGVRPLFGNKAVDTFFPATYDDPFQGMENPPVQVVGSAFKPTGSADQIGVEFVGFQEIDVASEFFTIDGPVYEDAPLKLSSTDCAAMAYDYAMSNIEERHNPVVYSEQQKAHAKYVCGVAGAELQDNNWEVSVSYGDPNILDVPEYWQPWDASNTKGCPTTQQCLNWGKATYTPNIAAQENTKWEANPEVYKEKAASSTWAYKTASYIFKNWTCGERFFITSGTDDYNDYKMNIETATLTESKFGINFHKNWIKEAEQWKALFWTTTVYALWNASLGKLTGKSKVHNDLTFIGHSMGGALSEILAAYYLRDILAPTPALKYGVDGSHSFKKNVHVVTFGKPPNTTKKDPCDDLHKCPFFGIGSIDDQLPAEKRSKRWVNAEIKCDDGETRNIDLVPHVVGDVNPFDHVSTIRWQQVAIDHVSNWSRTNQDLNIKCRQEGNTVNGNFYNELYTFGFPNSSACWKNWNNYEGSRLVELHSINNKYLPHITLAFQLAHKYGTGLVDGSSYCHNCWEGEPSNWY